MMRRLILLSSITIVLFMMLIPYSKGFSEHLYTVKKGDSLYEISRLFNVPIHELKKVNQLKDDILKPGQTLIISSQGAKVKTYSTQTPKLQKEKMMAVNQKEIEYYNVKPGDNLFAISKRVGVSIDEIKRLNRLDSDRLKVGQKLILKKGKKIDEEVEELGDGEPLELIEAEFKQKQQDDDISPSVEKWKGEEERNLFIRVVKTFLGVPYKLGGSTLRGIDCSAFVKKIYEIFNVNLPRTAREQLRYLFSKKVENKDELKEGDLVFFKTARLNSVHVGIYIGNNQFVHASSRNGEVKIDSLDTPYFKQRFITGVRVKEWEVDS